jgi:hypothetical protein
MNKTVRAVMEHQGKVMVMLAKILILDQLT